MRRFFKFVNEVRKELKALLTGSLFLAILGIYQTTTSRTVPPWVYWLVVFVFMVWAFFGAWNKQLSRTEELEHELKQETAKPAKVKFTFYELDRSPRSQGEIGRHVFIRLKLELLEPIQVSIDNFKMKFSHDGVIDIPQFVDDLAEWEATNWNSPILHQELPKLPTTLTAGEPREGYAHFVTEQGDRYLDRCFLRFFVYTSRGVCSDELRPPPPGVEYWNPTAGKMITKKH
jgi:hypothetical protein